MICQDLTSLNIVKVKVKATRLVRKKVSPQNIKFHAQTSSRRHISVNAHPEM